MPPPLPALWCWMTSEELAPIGDECQGFPAITGWPDGLSSVGQTFAAATDGLPMARRAIFVAYWRELLFSNLASLVGRERPRSGCCGRFQQRRRFRSGAARYHESDPGYYSTTLITPFACDHDQSHRDAPNRLLLHKIPVGDIPVLRRERTKRDVLSVQLLGNSDLLTDAQQWHLNMVLDHDVVHVDEQSRDRFGIRLASRLIQRLVILVTAKSRVVLTDPLVRFLRDVRAIFPCIPRPHETEKVAAMRAIG